MRTRSNGLLMVVALLAMPFSIFAQSVTPVGTAVAVAAGYEPAVAQLPNGDFVVVWDNSSSVQGSKVTAGVPGAPFAVGTSGAYMPTPDADVNATGSFVVVWDNSYSITDSIGAQRFDATGAPVGGEIGVGGVSGQFWMYPKVAINDTGQFVVAWKTYPYAWVEGFNADGSQAFAPVPLGSSFNQYNSPDVAIDSSGNFIVAWRSSNYISARTFDFTGTPIGTAFTIGGGSGYDPADPSVATLGSNFVVVWNEGFYVGKGLPRKTSRAPWALGDVNGRLANTAGPVGPQFLVAASPYYTGGARVAANSTSFVVTWFDGISSGPIVGRLFDNAAAPLGTLFTATSSASANNVSINENGTFTVAWNPGTVYTQAFQTCPDNSVAPTLTAPANASFLPEASPVNFTWSAITGATDYDVSISVNAGTPTIVNVATNSYSQTVAPGAITWTVTANFITPCPPTAASATGSFTVCPTPTEPVRTAPADLSPHPAGSTINFAWNAVPNAVGYDVYVKVDGGAASLVGSTVAPTTTLSQTVASGSIEWYVIANYAAGCASSPVPATGGMFTVCHTPTAPILVSPTGGLGVTASSPVTFQWNAAPNATSYDVFVGVNAATPALVGTVTAPTTSLTTAVAPGSIDWYVVANYGTGCAVGTSATGVFTVCPTPTEPVRSAPADATTFPSGSTVNFAWNAVPAAASYDVFIKVDGGAASLLGSATAPTTTLSQVVPSGSIEWYVIANYAAGCTPSPVPTTGGMFTVCHTPTAVTLVAPIGGLSVIVSSPVTFQWSGVPNATAYEVFAGVNGAPPSLVGTVTAPTTSLTTAVAAGSVDWYVVSKFGTGCGTATSTTEMFTVCPVITPPTLLSPANGDSVVSPVTLQWSDVGASIYEVYVGVNGATPTLVGATTTTSLTATIAEGSVDWHVKAFVGSCYAISSTHVFTVGVPFICPTPVTPDLVKPDEGATFKVGDPVTYEWTAAANATKYEVWASIDGAVPQFVGATSGSINSLTRLALQGVTQWHVITYFGPGCVSTTTGSRKFSAGAEPPIPPGPCGVDDTPIVSVVAEATTGETYVLRWDPLESISKYRVQESSEPTFSTGIIFDTVVSESLQATFSHPDLTAPTAFYYRVAGVPDCDTTLTGPFSTIIRVVGLPKPPPSSTNPQVVSEFGNTDFVETFLFIPGFGSSGKTVSAASFTASSNEPWLTPSPASGDLPPDGTTIKLIANPAGIDLGANTATITVTRDDGLPGKTTYGTTTSSVPVAVSLVTPVTSAGKTAGPPENALFIPAVANVSGLTSKWFSDVKVTNRSNQTINYEMHFSATDQSGTVSGKLAKITIKPGKTVAIDDVVRQWYGFGDLADGTNGALEIRPINFPGKDGGTEQGPMLATVASSRTYTRNENSLASFGQFIPAVPFSGFLKSGVENALLTMQQVSQTDSLRTNFGVVEGAGKDVNILMTAYDRQGAKLGEFPVSLKAGEHKQLNSLLFLNGITVEDGRMTVQIVSGEGAVTSYASVVASGTGDPSLVPGVDPSKIRAKKYVLPGVADLRAGGAAWRSDVRIFNPNPTSETVNIFFYPQGETTPLGPISLEIQPGEIKVLLSVVASLFGREDLGGALHIVPASGQDTALIVTGETYDISELGKYGQFISGVTEANAIGLGSQGLEVMQVEDSAQFRTNLGIAEVTGQSVTAQVTLTVPNSLIAPTKFVALGGNEFQQLNGIVREMTGGRDVYNGRLTIRVTAGNGKITAYGSTVDVQTRDATFSPGQ